MPPFVTHALVPFSTHSSVASAYTALVRMAPTSLPASGSDEQNAPSLMSPGPPNICGSHSPICSCVPFELTATAARQLPVSASPIPASPQNSSSNATGVPSPVGSSHCCPKNSSEYRPILAASSRIGHGVSSRSSHSEAAGRITFSANSCTQSRISRTSSDRSRLNAAPARSLSPARSPSPARSLSLMPLLAPGPVRSRAPRLLLNSSMTARRRCPQGRDRQAGKLVAEAVRVSAAVQHESSAEPGAKPTLQNPERTEVVRPDGLSGLDLDTHDLTGVVLKQLVNVIPVPVPVPVAVVVEASGRSCPGELPQQFAEHKILDQGADRWHSYSAGR